MSVVETRHGRFSPLAHRVIVDGCEVVTLIPVKEASE